MPKQTFFNLPKDKKESLINSAMKEFSRVPLFKASISNIIKEAGIPRGSFYQYFEDKEDLFLFLLEEYSKRNNDKFISILKEQDGDLIDAFIEFFKIILKNFQNIEYRNFFRNAFLNMNYKVENSLTLNVNEDKINNHFLETLRLINIQKLNITDEQEVFHVMKIIMAVTFQNIIQVFAKELSMAESIRNYTLEINLLKKGLYKQEGHA
ncbi:TetR/AcrR family transcriptional regulator [Brevibacillus daliensis]|uniref:TetR/AcrR family transcriptional regulator n=1 Tax=Brevibacillus daliensis TaxID=2892995 RepID=UPI001E32B68A|nr:TetR family transcriptional regulator [Brevibacillus daliensis]